jgi:hypothetical protein
MFCRQECSDAALSGAEILVQPVYDEKKSPRVIFIGCAVGRPGPQVPKCVHVGYPR